MHSQNLTEKVVQVVQALKSIFQKKIQIGKKYIFKKIHSNEIYFLNKFKVNEIHLQAAAVEYVGLAWSW